MAVLNNFNIIIYEGRNYEDATAKIVEAGFEANLYQADKLISYYSPISGWKSYLRTEYLSRPGDYASVLAEETGIDYSSALAMCNMD